MAVGENILLSRWPHPSLSDIVPHGQLLEQTEGQAASVKQDLEDQEDRHLWLDDFADDVGTMK